MTAERALLLSLARLAERSLEHELIKSGGDANIERAWLALSELILRVSELEQVQEREREEP